MGPQMPGFRTKPPSVWCFNVFHIRKGSCSRRLHFFLGGFDYMQGIWRENHEKSNVAKASHPDHREQSLDQAPRINDIDRLLKKSLAPQKWHPKRNHLESGWWFGTVFLSSIGNFMEFHHRT